MITNPLSPQKRQEMQTMWNNHKLLKLMGCRLDFSHDEYLLVSIDKLNDTHRGGMSTTAVNGGVMSSLFDLMTGLVGILNSDSYRTGTVNLNISFLKPLHGNSLYGKAFLQKKGQRLVFTRSELYDEKDNLCATCEGICSVDRSKPQLDNFLVT